MSEKKQIIEPRKKAKMQGIDDLGQAVFAFNMGATIGEILKRFDGVVILKGESELGKFACIRILDDDSEIQELRMKFALKQSEEILKEKVAKEEKERLK